jgi:hypothetical protein
MLVPICNVQHGAEKQAIVKTSVLGYHYNTPFSYHGTVDWAQYTFTVKAFYK